jgi:hypothetical protein
MFITFIIDEKHDQLWWEQECIVLLKSFVNKFDVKDYIGFLRKIDGINNFSYFSFHLGIDKYISDEKEFSSIWYKNAFLDYSKIPVFDVEQEKVKLDFLKKGAVKIWVS